MHANTGKPQIDHAASAILVEHFRNSIQYSTQDAGRVTGESILV